MNETYSLNSVISNCCFGRPRFILKLQVQNNKTMRRLGSIALVVCCLTALSVMAAEVPPDPTHFVASEPVKYADGRPGARWRLEARDAGRVLKHGAGPGQCDYLGARDIWVWESGASFYMHYDGAGTNGWLACLATSTNLTN